MSANDDTPPWARRRLGEVLGGRFELQAVVGHGAVGAVFCAADLREGGAAAVKVLRPGFARSERLARRFAREVRLLERLRHRAIPALLAWGEDGSGVPYFASEYVDGETLRDAVARRGSLPRDEALRVGAGVAEALDAVHRCGAIHRDVKPSNVMLPRSSAAPGEVRLVDFGVARCADEDLVTGSWEELGTPAYMAPEQRAGSPEPVSPATDLHALGWTLLELLVDAGRARELRATPPHVWPVGPDDALRYVASLVAPSPIARPSPARLVARTLRSLAGDVPTAGRSLDVDVGVFMASGASDEARSRARGLTARLRRHTIDQARFDGRLVEADDPRVAEAERRIRERANAEQDRLLAALDEALGEASEAAAARPSL